MIDERIQKCLDEMVAAHRTYADAQLMFKAHLDAAYGELIKNSTIGEDYIPCLQQIKAVAKAKADGKEGEFHAKAQDLFTLLDELGADPRQLKLQAVR